MKQGLATETQLIIQLAFTYGMGTGIGYKLVKA